jgi:hypothetical protein
MLGMNLWDKTTLEMNRLMYWPSHSRDVPPVFDVQNRGILNVDSVLATYKDYTDISEWAKFPTETEIRVGNEKGAMQDPREKPHVIGAFCRAYGVNEAIAQFLPDVYRVSSHDPNRYTFIGGESSNGAVVYDNLHLYSNHQTDPVHGKSLNAFDLVRVHKFGHLDADLDDFERLDLRELPSQIAMVQWANDLPEIRNEIAKTVLGDFERARDLIEGATGEADLRHRVITEIKHIDMQPVDREKVAKLIQQKLEQMAGAKVQIGICRDLIAPRVDVLSESDSPEWVQGYFYILTENRFYNISNGALLDKSGFNGSLTAGLYPPSCAVCTCPTITRPLPLTIKPASIPTGLIPCRKAGQERLPMRTRRQWLWCVSISVCCLTSVRNWPGSLSNG